MGYSTASNSKTWKKYNFLPNNGVKVSMNYQYNFRKYCEIVDE